MPEQMSFDFEGSAPAPVNKEAPNNLEGLATTELEKLFNEKVGFDPTMRFLGQEESDRRVTLIQGILDPKKGRDLVAEWDADYDKIGDAWSGK